jgi:hypothetical protein
LISNAPSANIYKQKVGKNSSKIILYGFLASAGQSYEQPSMERAVDKS